MNNLRSTVVPFVGGALLYVGLTLLLESVIFWGAVFIVIALVLGCVAAD